MDVNRSIKVTDKDGNFDYEAFAALTGGKQDTRTVAKKKDSSTSTRITSESSGPGTQSTTTTEVTLGGETIVVPGTETGEGTKTDEENKKEETTTNTGLPDEARGFAPPPSTGEDSSEENKKEEKGGTEKGGTETEGTETTNTNTEESLTLGDVSAPVSEETIETYENNASELKKLEEKVAKLKESLKEGGYENKKELEEAQEAEDELSAIELEELEEALEEEKFSKPLSTFRAGVRKGEISMQDVDLKIKILSAQYKKGSISKAKYDKDIKFISEKIMPLLSDDIPGAQKDQEKEEQSSSATALNIPVSSFVEKGSEQVKVGTKADQTSRQTILSIVSEHESGKGDEGYKAIFGSPTGPKIYKDGGPPLTERTIKEVLEFQRETINDGVFRERRAWEAITEQRPFDSTTGTKEFWDEKIKKAGLTQEQIEDTEFMLGPEGRMRNMKPFSSASGKYQFMKDTIEGLLESGAIKEGDVFNKETQDKMALALIGERNIKKFLDGKMSTNSFAKKLAKIWSSIPNEKNESVYQNISGNKALSKFKDLIAKLEKTKKIKGDAIAQS